MTRGLMLAAALMASGLTAGCDASSAEVPPELHPPEDFPLAFYHLDCAPWDGAAVSVYLVQEPMTEPWPAPAPHLRVSLYTTIPDLLRRTVEWGSGEMDLGHAARCPEEGRCESATYARVRFGERDADGDWLSGDLELRFADGAREVGSFHAKRLDFLPLCG